MLGDSVAPGGKLPAQGFSETYVCPQAFSGQYRILVRRVWGKVTAGKVKVDIYTHFGTKQVEQVSTKSLPSARTIPSVSFNWPMVGGKNRSTSGAWPRPWPGKLP